MYADLRKKIVETITHANEGHIPSAFSIIDIVARIYEKHLTFDSRRPDWTGRDYFILSKGHGCAALNVVLHRHGFIQQSDLDQCSRFEGILGGHPDRTKVPGVEASTGSLGHGFPFAVGIALGLKIDRKPNKVIVVAGDGECHEGTIWEAALVAQNLGLDNLCCVVDLNGSAAQILPHPDMPGQWRAFGWRVLEIDGHDVEAIDWAMERFKNDGNGKPTVVIAATVKGKGVRFLETHGPWHHKVPNAAEFEAIMKELGQ